MAPAETTERDGTRPNPPVLGSLAYLALNLPLGIAAFTALATMIPLGVGTVIIWIGVPILALALLLWRSAARLERARVHAMLGTYIAAPYRPLPTGLKAGWRTRLGDPATWKDMAYLALLLPIGIAEFTLMVALWSTSLWLLFLPAILGFLPHEWHPVAWDGPLFGVDTAVEALPWAALGALLLAMTVVLTRALGSLHARYARAMLGPSPRALDAMAPSTSPARGSARGMNYTTSLFPGV